MKDIIKHASGFIFIFLVFNAIWTNVSFDQVSSEWKIIIELFLGPLVFLGVFLVLIIRIFWKVPLIKDLIRPFFATNPNLQGTWKGMIEYMCDKESKESKEKEVFLVITQEDAFTVHCRLLTDERESESFNANFYIEGGRWNLSYQYRSSEAIKRHDENPIHTGTTILALDNSAKLFKLDGLYYTSRNTRGNLSLMKLSRKLAKSYGSAKHLKSVE